MDKTGFTKSLSRVLCVVLIAAMALGTTACGDGKNREQGAVQTPIYQDSGVLGEGEREFSLTVTDLSGGVWDFTIRTDQTVVGAALLELGLIAGEEGPFGLFIKSVNGISADYDADGAYWSFYVDGGYAMTGVDVTEIVPGSTYGLKMEKA